MAKIIQYTQEQEEALQEWINSRPQVIKDLIKKYNLRRGVLYRLKPTGQKVVLYSLFEDGTVSVTVDSRFNPNIISLLGDSYDVFGINPDDLEECDWDGEVIDGSTFG